MDRVIMAPSSAHKRKMSCQPCAVSAVCILGRHVREGTLLRGPVGLILNPIQHQAVQGKALQTFDLALCNVLHGGCLGA